MVDSWVITMRHGFGCGTTALSLLSSGVGEQYDAKGGADLKVSLTSETGWHLCGQPHQLICLHGIALRRQ